MIEALRAFFDMLEKEGMEAPANQLRRRLDRQIAENAHGNSSTMYVVFFFVEKNDNDKNFLTTKTIIF